MITLSRSLIRNVRQLAVRLFRPPASRGSEPALPFQSPEPRTLLAPSPAGTLLTVRWQGRQLTRLVSPEPIPQAVACDWGWLREVAASSGELNLTVGQDELVLHWQDSGFPQTRTLVASIEEEPVAAAPPLVPLDPRLLPALAMAREVTDPRSLRYALGHIQLDGVHGTLSATDGKQLIQYVGFEFPWRDRALLVPATDLFGAAPILQVKSLQGGATEQELVLRADDWTIRLWLNQQGRFPAVEQVLHQLGWIYNRVYLAPTDLEFFDRHFKRIPGAKRDNAPVTLDLNSQVEVIATGDEQRESLRMRLGRSLHLGAPVRCSFNRHFLLRAARLKTKEWWRFGDRQPLVCQGDQVTYAVQPLEGVADPDDSDDFRLVDSLRQR